MASRVPFLTVRPDDQFSSDVDTHDLVNANGIMAPPATVTRSTIPSRLRFPAAVLVTFSLSSLLYSLAADVTGPELAAVSRNLTSGWHIGVMVAWKLAELSIAWYACYDYLDLAYLTLLNQVPHYFLLNTFYGVDYYAALVPLVIDVLSISVPFALLRGLDHGHKNSAVKTPNQQVVQDISVQYLTALFGSAVYAIIVYGSFQTWLPVYMVSHFDGVRSLEKVHSTGIPLLFLIFGPLGYGATQFIFVPAIGSMSNPGITDPRIAPRKSLFNPETATFTETIAYNIGFGEAGVTPRAKILAKRTAILAASTFINSFVRTYVTIEGTELFGALGWATVWGASAGLTGLAFGWVGNE